LNGYEWTRDEDNDSIDRDQKSYRLKVFSCQDVERLEEQTKNLAG
jgi:hypothetical protein